jgi:hypothetical protein
MQLARSLAFTVLEMVKEHVSSLPVGSFKGGHGVQGINGLMFVNNKFRLKLSGAGINQTGGPWLERSRN